MAEQLDLELVFRRHQHEVSAYLLRVTGDRAVAEDLAQDVFVRAFRSAARFRGESSVRTWLFVIARNTLANHFRRREPATLEASETDIVVTIDPTQQMAIDETLHRLPVWAREAIVLCDALGFEPTEAADMVGVTANAFRVRLHRARAAFQKAYTP